MPLNISDDGDILERECVILLETKLHAYIEIWTRYIGNDRTAKPIALPHLDTMLQRERQLFCQYHYSAFESIVGMKLIVHTISNFQIETLPGYIQANNAFLAFQAHVGRIYDCVKEMGELFDIDDLAKELYDYYQGRHVILHGCKIPFTILDNELAIPEIRGHDEDEEKWGTKK